MRISDWSSDVCSSDLIDHLLGAAADVREHLFPGPHRLCVAPYGEVAVAQRLLAHFERAAFGLPLGEPAIEQRDIVRAEQLQEPPAARRALQRAVVVKHDAAAVAEPEKSEEHTSELQSLMRISYAVF